MSIRPVDYQILMPKVNEVAKLQNAEHHKIVSQVQQQAENSAKLAEQDTKSVHTQKEAQKLSINEKQKENRKNKGQDKKGEDSKDDSEETTRRTRANNNEGHTIDIRI